MSFIFSRLFVYIIGLMFVLWHDAMPVNVANIIKRYYKLINTDKISYII